MSPESGTVKYLETVPESGKDFDLKILTYPEFELMIKECSGRDFTYLRYLINTLDVDPKIIDLEQDQVAEWFNHPPKSVAIAYINEVVGYGIFAIEDIEEGEKLGVYTAKIITEATDNRYAWETFYETTSNSNPDATPTEEQSITQTVCYMDAKECGNELVFANDAPTDITTQAFYHDLELLGIKDANVTSVRITHNQIGLICYVANKKINKGEQILVDYGDNYWRASGRGFFDNEHNFYLLVNNEGRYVFQKYSPTAYNIPSQVTLIYPTIMPAEQPAVTEKTSVPVEEAPIETVGVEQLPDQPQTPSEKFEFDPEAGTITNLTRYIKYLLKPFLR